MLPRIAPASLILGTSRVHVASGIGETRPINRVPGTLHAGRPRGGPLTLIRILFGVINAVLRAATSSFLLLISMLVAAVGVLALVGFLAVGLSGVIGLRLSRRRTNKPDQR